MAISKCAAVGCDQTFPRRLTGRRRLFCSDKCRDGARKTRNYAVSGQVRLAVPDYHETPTNNSINAGTFGCPKLGRGSGIEGPRNVVLVELLDRAWDEIESGDGVRSYVSNLPKSMVQ